MTTTFSERERAFVRAVARGLTIHDAAPELGVTERVAEYTAERVRLKLRVKFLREVPMAYWKLTNDYPWPIPAGAQGMQVLNTPTLVECNQRAIEAEQNRTLDPEALKDLDPDGVHIVTFSMWHENYAGTAGIRAMLLAKMKGKEEPAHATLDFMPDDFASLSKLEEPVEVEA